MTKYDHHRKAGNQGDVVKHPALIAAVSELAKDTADKFVYLDAFSGHATHPLRDGSEYEWQYGIGRLSSKTSTNPHVQQWQTNYLTPGTSSYPGSVLIALDTLRRLNVNYEIHACDRLQEPLASLKNHFALDANIHIHEAKIVSDDETEWPSRVHEVVEVSDILFLDPPGLRSSKHPEFPRWSLFKEIMLMRKGRGTLMWFPTVGLPKDWTRWSQENHHRRVAAAMKLGYGATYARWNSGRGKAACFMLYNFAHEPIREAIESVMDLTDWKANVEKTVGADQTRRAVLHAN